MVVSDRAPSSLSTGWLQCRSRSSTAKSNLSGTFTVSTRASRCGAANPLLMGDPSVVAARRLAGCRTARTVTEPVDEKAVLLVDGVDTT